MPDELKVDRSYHEALRRIGVKNPGEVRVGVPVQLTAPVDDLSHLTPPVPVAIASTGVTFIAAAVGVRNIPVEWQIRSLGGAWLLAAGSVTGDHRICVGATSFITAGAAALVAGLNTGGLGDTPALLSTAQQGTTNIAQASLRGAGVGSDGTVFLGVYLPLGSFAALIGKDSNASAGGWMMIQEVP